MKISASGFVDADQQNVSVTNGQATPLDIAMQITTAAQQVDVNASGVGTVSVDPSANAGAIVLSETDLDALPDDPDDLETATGGDGRSAVRGPNRPGAFIDGFSGGQMPPKSSIRGVGINSNPFASEFDTPGFRLNPDFYAKPGNRCVSRQRVLHLWRP